MCNELDILFLLHVSAMSSMYWGKNEIKFWFSALFQGMRAGLMWGCRAFHLAERGPAVAIATDFVYGCHMDSTHLLHSTVAPHCLFSFVKIVQMLSEE